MECNQKKSLASLAMLDDLPLNRLFVYRNYDIVLSNKRVFSLPSAVRNSVSVGLAVRFSPSFSSFDRVPSAP